MTEIISNSLALFMNGPLLKQESLSLYLPTDPNPSGSLSLFIKSVNHDYSWPNLTDEWQNYSGVTWENWKAGISSGIIGTGLSLHTIGGTVIPFSGNLSIFMNVINSGVADDSLDLYLKTVEEFNQSLSLFQAVESNPSGSLLLFTRGTSSTYSGFIYDNLSLYTSGNNVITQSGILPLFIKVSATGTLDTSIPLFTVGMGIPIDSNLSLFLHNSYIGSGLPLFTLGHWTHWGSGIVTSLQGNESTRKSGSSNYSAAVKEFSFGETQTPSEEIFEDVFDSRRHVMFNSEVRTGAYAVYNSLPLLLYNVGTAGSLRLFIKNEVAESGLSLYTYGINNPSGSLTLFMTNGLGTISGYLPLTTRGYYSSV